MVQHGLAASVGTVWGSTTSGALACIVRGKLTADKPIYFKCGNKEAEFYPRKCKKTGETISSCIRYNGRWINPLEFESLAGLCMVENGEKTKYEEKPIGKWLNEHECDLGSQKSSGDTPPPSTAPQGENIDKESRVVGESPTPATSVIMSSINHVEHLNETTPPIVPENREESPEHLTISEELESQLAATVKRIVEQAIVSFKENVQKEFQLLKATIVALANRVLELEEKIAINTTDHSETEETQPANNTVIAVSSNIEEHQQQLQLLQSQVQSLSMQQKITEREKEREKRICNVLLGNIEEKHSESAADAVLQVFKDKLKVDLSPVNAVRLGKFRDGKRRLILVQMRNSEKKLTLLFKKRKVS